MDHIHLQLKIYLKMAYAVSTVRVVTKSLLTNSMLSMFLRAGISKLQHLLNFRSELKFRRINLLPSRRMLLLPYRRIHLLPFLARLNRHSPRSRIHQPRQEDQYHRHRLDGPALCQARLYRHLPRSLIHQSPQKRQHQRPQPKCPALCQAKLYPHLPRSRIHWSPRQCQHQRPPPKCPALCQA